MIKLKNILQEATVPRTIGYKNKPDFSHGLVKAFFEFFYVPGGGQPVGTFIDMANKVMEKYPEMEPLIDDVGEVCNKMYDYLKPPGGEESPYDLNDLTQSAAAQKIYDYMNKANKLGKTIIQTTDKANPNKLASGLKGLKGMLEKAKDIFTSSFGPVKNKSRIGFKFKGESINEGKEKWIVYDIETKKRLPNAGKSWATMKAADAFAAKQKNAEVASAEWYYDKIQESINEAKKFKNKEEVVDALVKDFGKNKKSYYNTPTNKQNEKYWTYNRTAKYYYELVKKNESINEGFLADLPTWVWALSYAAPFLWMTWEILVSGFEDGKLRRKLSPSGWVELIKLFLKKSKTKQIINTLSQDPEIKSMMGDVKSGKEKQWKLKNLLSKKMSAKQKDIVKKEFDYVIRYDDVAKRLLNKESVNESKKTQYITDQEQADKVVATFLKQGKTKEWIKSNIGRNRTELKYIGRALKTVKKSANEVDFHSKLSRGHKPDWYQLNTPEFKPFDKSKDDLEEAEYQGRKVKLNKPTRGDVKKFKVYVSTGKKNKDGTMKIKKVNFGHGGTSAKKAGEETMSIRKNNPEARKSFRARHKCDQKKDRTSAGYWSCKAW